MEWKHLFFPVKNSLCKGNKDIFNRIRQSRLYEFFNLCYLFWLLYDLWRSFCFRKNFLNLHLGKHFKIDPLSKVKLLPEPTEIQFKEFKDSYLDEDNVIWSQTRKEYGSQLLQLAEKRDHGYMNLLYMEVGEGLTEDSLVSLACVKYRSGEFDTFLKILVQIREKHSEDSSEFFSLLPFFCNYCLSLGLKNIAEEIIWQLSENKPVSLSLDYHNYLELIILDLKARFFLICGKENKAFLKMEEKMHRAGGDALREKSWQLVFVSAALESGTINHDEKMQRYIQNEVPGIREKVSENS